MDRVFLDANVLYSAAYQPASSLTRLWELPEAHLVTSAYAYHEARINLREEDQRERLDRLMGSVEMLERVPAPAPLPAGVELPPKDRPILSSAVATKATHLLTGDFQHFGPYFGRTVAGVLILPPGEYLRTAQR